MRAVKDDLVGKVIHYYDKIGVAVIKLDKPLKVGDKVKVNTESGEYLERVKK